MNNLIKLITLTFSLFLSVQANAALIQGEFDYAGFGEVTVTGTNVSFEANNIYISGTAGNFNSFGGTLGTISDFDFSTLSETSPVEFLTLSSSSGNTASLNITQAILFTDASTSNLHMTGKGFFSMNGFDNTAAAWDLFSNGSFFIGTAVPEPAALALFGMGLLGLTFARRKRTS